MKIVAAFFTIVILLFITLFIATSRTSHNSSLPAKENQTNSQASTPTSTEERVTVLAQGLEIPWAIAFLPDGSLLITERPGRLRILDADRILDPRPVATLSQVKQIGEGGLLGITLDPDFVHNNFIYLYYTYSSNGTNTLNKVVRMTYGGRKLTNETVIIDQIPGSQFHDGGRIKFGPDGYLYITTGDAENPSLAQDKGARAGKILRIKKDGTPAPFNPFNSRVYSYGHRNPQGIAWSPSGQLWATEHGRSNPTGFDELNLIKPGLNYGWPTIEGDETRAGMETPKLNSGPTTTWAPAGAAFIGYSLYFGGLKGSALYQITITGNQAINLKEHLKNEFGRIREVIAGPDGMLYITTSNRDGRGEPKDGDDKVIRVNPKKL